MRHQRPFVEARIQDAAVHRDVEFCKKQDAPELFRGDYPVGGEESMPSEGIWEAEGDAARARGRGEADARDGDAACVVAVVKRLTRLRSKNRLVQDCDFFDLARQVGAFSSSF